MATKVIKTAGQVAYEDYRAAADIPFTWEQTAKAAWEAFAAKHNIQPIVEEVADKPTDGEPLPVTAADIVRWSCKFFSGFSGLKQREFADAINQHRGVRPVPQVTAEMLEQALRRETLVGAAESLNAELAKAATTATVTPMKVAAYATLNSHLHTFECAEDMKAFTRANDFSQAGYIDGHEHHPRKDGGN